MVFASWPVCFDFQIHSFLLFVIQLIMMTLSHMEIAVLLTALLLAGAALPLVFVGALISALAGFTLSQYIQNRQIIPPEASFVQSIEIAREIHEHPHENSAHAVMYGIMWD